MVQVILAGIILAIGIVAVFLLYRARKNQHERKAYVSHKSIRDLC